MNAQTHFESASASPPMSERLFRYSITLCYLGAIVVLVAGWAARSDIGSAGAIGVTIVGLIVTVGGAGIFYRFKSQLIQPDPAVPSWPMMVFIVLRDGFALHAVYRIFWPVLERLF